MSESGIPSVHCVGVMNTSRRARATQRMIATVRSRARFRQLELEEKGKDVRTDEQGKSSMKGKRKRVGKKQGRDTVEDRSADFA